MYIFANESSPKSDKAISFYVNTYTERIAPVFDRIDEEPTEKADAYFEQAGSSFNPDRDDPADFA